MINPVSMNVSNSTVCRPPIRKTPSFGSVMLARVLQREIIGNRAYYSLLSYGDSGVFQSLTRGINSQSSKFAKIAEKLQKIKDFDITRPFVRSTHVGTRSATRRYFMTGFDAQDLDNMGKDFIGGMGDKYLYRDSIVGDILRKSSNRVKTDDGVELGLEVIVERQKGKNKIVDVDFRPIENLFERRGSEPVDVSVTPVVQASPIVIEKSAEPVQKSGQMLFDF